MDPLSAHPHQADIDSLIRLCNCGNVIVCPNPTSAMALIHTLRIALETGNRGMVRTYDFEHECPFCKIINICLNFPCTILSFSFVQLPSFFTTLESPAVEEYKVRNQ